MEDKKEAQKVYNNLAEFYHNKRLVGGDWNEVLEKPTTFSLLKNIKGKKVLDAGCGSGIYSKLLAKKGAKVFGIDNSSKMIELARNYCKKDKIDFKVGSIDKLPYKNNFFEGIVASLVIHYLKSPEKAFKEFNRVLKKNGFLIFSTNHPVFGAAEDIKRINRKKMLLLNNYFRKGKYYWGLHDKKNIKIPSYYFGFEKLFNILYRNNFVVELLKEPTVSKKNLNKFRLKKTKKYIDIPTFVVFRCRKIK